jgi:hypothetical protein
VRGVKQILKGLIFKARLRQSRFERGDSLRFRLFQLALARKLGIERCQFIGQLSLLHMFGRG